MRRFFVADEQFNTENITTTDTATAEPVEETVEPVETGEPVQETAETEQVVEQVQKAEQAEQAEAVEPIEQASEVVEGEKPTKKVRKTKTEKTSATKTQKPKTGSIKSQKELKRAKARIKESEKNPIAYFYNANLNKNQKLEFIEVKQGINDKFLGKIDQDQYYAVSELSKRVFQINRLHINEVVSSSLLYERLIFGVRISAKWFEEEVAMQQIDEIIKEFKDNIILIFDATTLFNAESAVLSKIKRYRENQHLKVMIDNIENQNLSLTVAASADIVRIDARYFDLKDDKYSTLMKFYRNYCREQNVKLAVKNITDKKQQTFFLNYGADYIEGPAVYTPKKSITTILRDFDIN